MSTRLKRLTLALALLVGAIVPAAAKADPITGQVSISGTDTYTNTSVTFNNPGAAVAGTATGTFTPYFALGGVVTFNMPTINFVSGVTQNYSRMLFLTITSGLETARFYINSLTAVVGPDPFTGLQTLNLSGMGSITETGIANFDETPGRFVITSQGAATTVTFSGTALATAVTPEPSSLLLLGTGLVCAAGLLFMKRRESMSFSM